jgi:heat shock protein HslJ
MKRVLIALLVVFSTLSFGCLQADGSDNALAGTAWRLTGWSAATPDPAQFATTAAFDDSRISGKAAVNSYGGACTATAGGDFSIGPLQSTMMAGTPEAMQAEQQYFTLLAQARKYTVTESTLTLLDAEAKALLVFGKQ